VDEQTWTYPTQVEQGARDLGLKANIVFGADKVLEAMAEPGHLVVVNVNPTPAYVHQLAEPYDGGHFALVTAIKGNKVYLNDPLAAGPIVISLHQLEVALTTPLGTSPNGRWVPPFNGGVAVWAAAN
jgi:ABC-type bacteriocin/lantibiotic exporter with double-glycine peptidase domain